MWNNRKQAILVLLQLLVWNAHTLSVARKKPPPRRLPSPRPPAPSSTDSNAHKIAIIGGGVAGLSCASALLTSDIPKKNLEVTVFDTGRLRPGGRCSSRRVGDRPKDGDKKDHPILSQYQLDHAAQLITVNQGADDFAEFVDQVEQWKEQGILKPFEPKTLYRLRQERDADKASTFSTTLQDLQPLSESSINCYYYAVDGMGSIPDAIAKHCETTASRSTMCSIDLRQDVWVSPSNGLKYNFKKSNQQWKISAKGQTLGWYDTVVIAHNGKCSDRLTSRTPAKRVHSLLRVNFAAMVGKRSKRMTLNSIYSLTVALNKRGADFLNAALPKSLVCAMVGHPTLSFLTCQSRKFPNADARDSDIQVWTIFSSPKFAKKHKAAQEFLSEETIANVSTVLMDDLQELLQNQLPPEQDDESFQLKDAVVDCRLQLWGAALPLNTYRNGHGFVYDNAYGIGVCGDWLLDASVGGAWTSGQRLAKHIATNVLTSERREPPPADEEVADSTTVGLDGVFERSEATLKAGIGAL